MTDSVERFSNRVANYVKYRPHYPKAIIDFLAANCGLTSTSIIADVGCGTGISARLFVENGNRVFGVEPNDSMRAAALEYLAAYSGFITVKGTADATTLSDASIDMVVAAQAFHWFDPEKAKPEFLRILKPDGWIVLIWNERQIDSTPFHAAYEAFLVKYGYDYGVVWHENITADELRDFFGATYGKARFSNFQIFDFEGLKGRMLSASYMPTEQDDNFREMIEELRLLFANHAENGKIKVLYDTNVYFRQV